jgi:hypothetical protein
VIDCAVFGEYGGAPIAVMRHTTIFRIAPPDASA